MRNSLSTKFKSSSKVMKPCYVKPTHGKQSTKPKPLRSRATWVRDGGSRAGVKFRRGVNPLRDRLKLDNCMTRAMQVVMKLVRVASNRHLRNWEAPDALVQEIIPVATPKIPVNVQRFTIHIYRYRSKGLEPSFSGSTDRSDVALYGPAY